MPFMVLPYYFIIVFKKNKSKNEMLTLYPLIYIKILYNSIDESKGGSYGCSDIKER